MAAISNGTDDVGVVKISDFLEFLNISFQVTDSITKQTARTSSINQLDFDQLQHNELITNLLSRANANRSASPTVGSADAKSKTKSIEEEKIDAAKKGTRGA